MTRPHLPLALSLLIAGCANSGDELSLRDDPPDHAALSERLHELQRLRVPGAQGDLELDVQEDVIPQLQTGCLASVNAARQAATCTTDDLQSWDTCNRMLCAAEMRLCRAHRLLEIADGVQTQQVGSYSVPPQTRAVNALLREVAAQESREAAVAAGEALRSAGGASAQGTCVVADLDDAGIWKDPDVTSMTMGQSLAGAFVEAYDIVWEASEGFVEDSFAAAEGHRAREGSIGDALWMRWHGDVLSYDHVAQFLLGSRDRLGPTDRGVCARSAADVDTRRTEETVGLIRLSGMDPAILGNRNYTIDNIFNGTGGVTGGGLAARLQERLGLDSMQLQEVGYGFANTEAEFNLARMRVADQAEAFTRVTSQPFVPVLVGGATPTFVYSAATVSPPVPVHALGTARAFGLLGAADAALTGSNPDVPSVAYAKSSVAAFVDWSATVASELRTYFTTAPDTFGQYPSIAALVSTSTRERLSRARLQYWTTGADKHLRVHLYGSFSSSQIRIVRGHAGLSCATEGSIEGQPCNLATYLVPTYYNPVALSSRQSGFLTRHEFELQSPATSDPHYVVQQRPRAGQSPNAPGGYELLYPVIIDWTTATPTPKNVTLADVPAIRHYGRYGASPYASSCEECDLTCALLPRGTRIPLEDQLSEDGDAYESSWRHYLETARIAADRADRLGEDLIERGYGLDDRTESALDDLEDTCGIGPDLLTFGSEGIDQIVANPATCSTDADCAATAGAVCVNARCVIDPIRRLEAERGHDPRINQLVECLGEDGDQILEFVAVGSQPLCLWRNDSASPAVYCDELPGDPSCPFVREGADCALPLGQPLPAGHSWVRVDHTVGSVPETLVEDYHEDESRPADCNLLRELRGRAATEADLQALRDSTTFDTNHIAELARRIGWTAEPRDISRVTVDNLSWTPPGLTSYAGTGRLSSGLNDGTSAWPCTARVRSEECGNELDPRRESLFCQQIACNNYVSRARINDRMARAVLALKITTAATFNNYFSPFYHDHSVSGVNQRPESQPDAVLDPIDPGDPVRYTTRTAVNVGSSCIENSGCLSGRPYWGHAYCRRSGLTTPSLWTTIDDDGLARDRDVTCNDLTDLRWFIVFDGSRHAANDPQLQFSGQLADVLWPSMWQGVANTGRAEAEESNTSLLRDYDFARSTYFRLLTMQDWQDPGTQVLGPRADGTGDNITHLTLWFHHNNENEVAIAGNWGEHPWSGDFARGLTARDLRDALDLLCEVDRSSELGCGANSTPPEVTTVRDLPALRHYINCVANRIHDASRTMVIGDVPAAALRGVATNDSSFTEGRGSYGAAVERYRGGLEGLGRHSPRLAQTLRSLARDLERMENLIIRNTAIREQQQVDAIANIAHALTSCAGGIADAVIQSVTSGGSAAAQGISSAAQSCAHAGVSIYQAIRTAELSRQITDTTQRDAMIDIEDSIDGKIEQMNQVERDLSQAASDLRAAGIDLATQRRAARRSVARAMLLDVDETGRHYHTNTVLRRRYNTTLTRYHRALRYAVQTSYLARLAIEQQVGMELNTLTEDMTLVDAPSSWADSICEVSGIDYSRVRDHTDLAFENYADQYVGEYVNRLEQFIESYRIDYPFQDAVDTTVVSLRREQSAGRGICEVDVNNHLAYSGSLDYAVTPDVPEGQTDPRPVWEVVGCASGVNTSCLNVRQAELSASQRPLADGHDRFSTQRAFDIVFAADDGDPSTPVGYTSATRLRQAVTPGAGRYRLSWYAIDPDGAGTLYGDPTSASPFSITLADGAPVVSSAVASAPTTTGWSRRYFVFDIGSGAETVYVTIRAPSPAEPTEQRWRVAAVMLERASREITSPSTIGPTFDPSSYPPGYYVETRSAARSSLPVCDTGPGSHLRWTRGCLELCPSGFAESCAAPGENRTRCYNELTFSVTPQAVAQGTAFQSGGFAQGNFNYRVDTVGVNFVGTNVRYCTDTLDPEICHSAGWIPYSLLHQGPHNVLNHRGEDSYTSPINPGRIEQARGLAAERYLSNPISSADMALIEPYFQRQLRGRPLTGQYFLRVWDTPGLSLADVEDVQLILRYRFWTRQH